MDTVERHRIENTRVQLQYSYARLIDFRDYEGFTELFAEDALLTLGGKELKGSEAIFGYCQTRPAGLCSRHVITNPFIDVLDDQTARGICYLTLYRSVTDPAAARVALPMPPGAAVDHYEDRFCRIGDQWFFQHRTAQIAFRDDSQF